MICQMNQEKENKDERKNDQCSSVTSKSEINYNASIIRSVFLFISNRENHDRFMLILGMIATYFFNKDGNTKGGANDGE